MAADPIHGHPPWALVLVAISVGESAGKAGPVWGEGQPSKGNFGSPSPARPAMGLNVSGGFTERNSRAGKRREWRFLSRLYTGLWEA